MKTSTQASADLTHLSQLIDGIPIAMLSTIKADGAGVWHAGLCRRRQTAGDGRVWSAQGFVC